MVNIKILLRILYTFLRLFLILTNFVNLEKMRSLQLSVSFILNALNNENRKYPENITSFTIFSISLYIAVLSTGSTSHVIYNIRSTQYFIFKIRENKIISFYLLMMNSETVWNSRMRLHYAREVFKLTSGLC